MRSSSKLARFATVAVVALGATIALIVVLTGGDDPSSTGRTASRQEAKRTESRTGTAKGDASSDRLVVRPGRSIGRVALGASLARVKRLLGRESSSGRRLHVWFVDGGGLSVRFRSQRAVSIYTNSSKYQLNGVTLADDFEDVRRALPDWRVEPCGD